jgi:hypothetical protein
VDNFATPLSTSGAGNFVKDFTPKFFNGTQAQSRSCTYPNGNPVPSTTDVNGVMTFHPVYTNAAGQLINGFTATGNVLTYTVIMPGACESVFPTMPFNVMLTAPLSVQALTAMLVGKNTIEASYVVSDLQDIVEMHVKYALHHPADLETIHTQAVTLTQKSGTLPFAAAANGYYAIVAKNASGVEKVSNMVHVQGLTAKTQLHYDGNAIYITGMDATTSYDIKMIDATCKVIAEHQHIKGAGAFVLSIGNGAPGLYMCLLTNRKTGETQVLKMMAR